MGSLRFTHEGGLTHDEVNTEAREGAAHEGAAHEGLGWSIIVSLGGVELALCGLSLLEIKPLREMWGPFVSEVTRVQELARRPETPSRALWRADLVDRTQRAQPEQIDYRRGVDVAISLRADRHVESWTDRSVGALEATLQVMLQWALEEIGGLLVHASAGVYQGQGWLIPGVSGAGKSTAAREGGFDQVLSDELVIVLPSPKETPLSEHTCQSAQPPYHLHSTPFWSEGRTAPLVIADAPLSMITFPYKAGGAELRPCGDAESVRRLLGAVTLYERRLTARSGAQRALLFERACEVVERTSCAILAFPRFGPWRARLS